MEEINDLLIQLNGVKERREIYSSSFIPKEYTVKIRGLDIERHELKKKLIDLISKL